MQICREKGKRKYVREEEKNGQQWKENRRIEMKQEKNGLEKIYLKKNGLEKVTRIRQIIVTQNRGNHRRWIKTNPEDAVVGRGEDSSLREHGRLTENHLKQEVYERREEKVKESQNNVKENIYREPRLFLTLHVSRIQGMMN